MKGQSRGEQIYNYRLYSFKRFFTFLKYAKITAKELAQITKRHEWAIVLDMVWCNLRYGASHSRDYTLFDFVKKNGHERNTFMTFRRYYRMVKKFDKATFLRYTLKNNMYEDYGQFIKRNWMCLDGSQSREQVAGFLLKYKTVIVKPVSSDQGNGISKFTFSSRQECESFCDDYLGRNVIIEESLNNCEELNAIHARSLNTVRVYIIVNKDGCPDIVTMALRCGQSDADIDNWGAGGVGYNIDLSYGVIDRPGRDKKGYFHVFHPGTDVCMVGYHIPMFNEVRQFALRVASLNKKVLFAGLDIAITPTGPELIEVNFPGGHDFLQCLDDVGKNELLQSVV